MKDIKKRLSPSMSTIVIALSVFIIAESIWLVGKLEEINQRASSRGSSPNLVNEQLTNKVESAAIVSLKGAVRVVKGESFPVQVTLKANQDFYSHGLDIVLGYDPQVLKALGRARIDPQSPFKTAGLNFIEEDKERILVTLIDESGKGFNFNLGNEYPLFSFEFEALEQGESFVMVKTSQGESARKTQVIDANTDELLLLDKEDLNVIVF
ncbi:hypothetical protein ISS42_02660 [Candidatus Shapirobacteria bacterium]|nr:hypothetical protein [Candidatus Shapirobacteria bacterium]